MNLKDYKDGLIVEVKGCSYGTFKTYSLEPKGKGARMVKVLHSSTIGEINWSLALLKTFRLVDLKVKEDKEAANHEFYLWATNEHHARLLRAIRADLKDILSEEVLNRTKVQTLFDCLATK